MPNPNYVAVVPQNQRIFNTPFDNKKFSSVGVPVLDTPLDTIIQVIANEEQFKVPSSKAVYDALRNLRESTVQIDYLTNTINNTNP